MSATSFDIDASLDERRVIIRRAGGEVEMVELAWGLQPRDRGGRSATVIRAEGRTFSSHRCLVPASEFRFRSQSRHYSVALVDGDWFYFAGIWRPASGDWPEAYAILTTEANPDVVPYLDRQMAVLRREERMAWLDMTCPEFELLRPLPAGSFIVSRLDKYTSQRTFDF